MTEDARMERARFYVERALGERVVVPTDLLADLYAYAEERLRVNVGLINENVALKKFDPVAILQEQAETEATGSRDFGRGYSQAIKVLETARKAKR